MNINHHEEVAGRIESRAAKVAVIGQGYVGLPLAIEFAGAGFSVAGLDTNPQRVAALNDGISCTPDVPGETLVRLLREGRFRASADFGLLAESDAVIICVPTPLRKSKDPDISFVAAAATQLAERFRPGQLVVLESTTYPGTTEELLLPLFEARGAAIGENFFLAFSPERIDPGNPTFRVKDIPKIVGGVTPRCSELAALLYRQIVTQVLTVSSPKVAELAKLYENVFRNVNVALANELSLMCRRLDVKTHEVIQAAATKPFGFIPFYPGPGIGGHCIPIDPLYLSWKMRINGYEARFIHLAEEVNRAMPEYVVELAMDGLNRRQRCLNGAKVLALGVAYKRGVGDTRESPAIEIVQRLMKKGAVLNYADPYVQSIEIGGTLLRSVEVTDELLASADCVLILTNHPEFDYRRVVERAGFVLDTRGATHGIPAPEGRVLTL